MGEGVAERSHLSIGEVLSLLRDEFPDVTISKIRFLESQGLVDPERTPSGYRKFYDQDVERLRWILLQQREHYMPLKVIRSRLSEGGGGADGNGAGAPAEAAADGADDLLAETATDHTGPEPTGEPSGADLDPAAAADRPTAERPVTPSLFAGLHRSEPGVTTDPPATVPPHAEAPPAPVPSAAGPAPAPAVSQDRPRRPPAPVPAPRAEASADEPDTYSAEELAEAAGAELSLIAELKQYGLIAPHAAVAGTQYYDESALAVTTAAAGFARHGVEARHLRMWRNAADREADLFQQVVLPLLRQRNPQARRQALDTLAELCGAGADLRAALVERAIREIR